MSREGETTGPSQHSIDRGLYVLRYVSSPADLPPIAAIRVRRGSVGFLSAPGRERAELARPGQALVIIARSAGVFDIELRSLRSGDVPSAHFTLDLLDRGDSSDDAGSEAVQRAAPLSLAFEAHLGRLGRVGVQAGEWIAGPDNPLPIEGLTIVGADTTGLFVQVRSSQQPDRWSRWYGPGQPAGGRDRSVALSGVRLRLHPPEGRVIIGEALFLGQAPIRRAGPEIEFAGNDPLVGLKLDVVDAAVGRTGPPIDLVRPVRVFAAVD